MVEVDLSSSGCTCAPEKRVSANGIAFLIDQGNERHFTLDSYLFGNNSGENVNVLLDSNESVPSPSCGRDQFSSLSPEEAENQLSIALASSASITDGGEEKDDDDPDYVPEYYSSFGVPRKVNIPGSLKETNFESVFAEAVRYDTGYGEAAAIMNRTLEVLGAITKEEKGFVVSKSFVRRGIKRIGKKMTRKWHEENVQSKMECFFFDGVKAKNLMYDGGQERSLGSGQFYSIREYNYGPAAI